MNQGFVISIFDKKNIEISKVSFFPYEDAGKDKAVVNRTDYLDWFEGENYLIKKEHIESILMPAVCGGENFTYQKNKQKVLEFEIIP